MISKVLIMPHDSIDVGVSTNLNVISRIPIG